MLLAVKIASVLVFIAVMVTLHYLVSGALSFASPDMLAGIFIGIGVTLFFAWLYRNDWSPSGEQRADRE